jgi:hypothetical protein
VGRTEKDSFMRIRTSFLALAASAAALLQRQPAAADEMTGNSNAGDLYQTGSAPAVQQGDHLAASTGYITPFYEVTNKLPATACLNAWSGHSNNGETIGMWACGESGNDSWRLTNSGALIGIDDKCATLASGAVFGSGIVLEPCNGSSSQAWDWYPDHTLRPYQANADLCLDMGVSPQSLEANPNQVASPSLTNCISGLTSQQWMIHGVGELRLGDHGSAITTTNPMCLDDGAMMSPGPTAALDLWACNGGANQKWVITPGGLIVGEWGLCLTEQGSDLSLELATCTGGWNQRFTYSSPNIIGWMSDDPSNGVSYVQAQYDTSNGGAIFDYAFANTPLARWTYVDRLTVPVITQEELNWCWLAATQMVIAYIGADPVWSQCVLANFAESGGNYSSGWGPGGSYVGCCPSSNSLPGSDPCNHGGDLYFTLGFLGYGATTTQGPVSFAALVGEFNAGRPVSFVAAWNQGFGAPNSHVMLVIGADQDSSGEQWVVVNDPAGDQVATPYSVWANTDTNQYMFTNVETVTNITKGGSWQ